jgi:hypothetical protein
MGGGGVIIHEEKERSDGPLFPDGGAGCLWRSRGPAIRAKSGRSEEIEFPPAEAGPRDISL